MVQYNGIFICFTLLLLVHSSLLAGHNEGKDGAVKSAEKQAVSGENEKTENGNPGEEKAHEAGVNAAEEEGKPKEEGENEKPTEESSQEGKHKKEGSEESKKSGEGVEGNGTKGGDESLEEIVEEDKKVVNEHYEKIKPRLDAAKKEEEQKHGAKGAAVHHPHGKKHGEEGEAKAVSPIEAVANAVANTKMNCPGLWSKFTSVFSRKKNAEEERREAEWAQNCAILEEFKPALVDWLEFIKDYAGENASKSAKSGGDAKHSEKDDKQEEEGNNNNYPEKMSVRPMLQVIRIVTAEEAAKEKVKGGEKGEEKQQQNGPKIDGEVLVFERILDIFEAIAKGGDKPDLKGQLEWYNMAACKFVRKMETDLKQAIKHKNSAEEEEKEGDLEKVWEGEKAALSGQSSEFKMEIHQKKYKEHVDAHKNSIWSKMGTVWNYGKSMVFGHHKEDKKEEKHGHEGKQEHGHGDKAGHGKQQKEEEKDGEDHKGGHKTKKELQLAA